MKKPNFIQVATAVINLKEAWHYLEANDIQVEDNLITRWKDFDVVYDGVTISVWGNDWDFKLNDAFDFDENHSDTWKKFTVSKELVKAYNEKYKEGKCEGEPTWET